MITPVKVGNLWVGEGHPTLFIAEVASAHEGNFDVAQKMIDAAADAGADAVKFQFLKKEAYMVPYHHIYPIVEKIEFSPAQWAALRDYARGKNILFIADAFDIPSCELAAILGADALKIHSADLSNPELIESVARTGKPVFMGVGATTMDEITAAINLVRKYHDQVVIMHGYQAFPTKLEEMNFNFVHTLHAAFGLPVGILDHTEGETFWSRVVPLLTPFVGAQVIEKHFVLNRSLRGIDYESSVNPATLKEIVQNLRTIEKMPGSGAPKVTYSEDEQKYRELMKKAIVAGHDVPVGKIVEQSDIAFMRAGPGLRPLDAHLIIGKRAKITIPKHARINLEQVGE